VIHERVSDSDYAQEEVLIQEARDNEENSNYNGENVCALPVTCSGPGNETTVSAETIKSHLLDKVNPRNS
jgi:hypothetical protein